MTLRIEAAEALQLVEALSLITGEEAETVVLVALRERLALMRTARVMPHLIALQEIFSKHPEAMIDHAELLYGEDGLPRVD